jgi:adenine specific DNA methylase Mod
VFSPSINLKKKKSLNSTRKLKKREEKRDRKGEKEKQNQRNKKGILSDPELFFSRLELHCLLSLQLTIVGSNTSVEAPMRYLCVRFWHVLHSMHLTCL